MRRELCESSLASSRSAEGETSIFQAMALHNFLKRYGLVFAAANAFERTLGQIQIFQLLQVLEDCLANIKAFCSPCAVCKSLKPFLDSLGKPNRQHVDLAIQV